MEMKFRTLRADEIDVRVGSASKDPQNPWCTLLLYKDARVDMRLLDEVVGAKNWKRSHELVNGNLYCTVSVWDNEKLEWVSKQDVGTESNTEAVKGQTSDAFKRACFNWGIGRELYSAPLIFIRGGSKETNAYVKEIGYGEDGNINRLVILGKKERRGNTECLFDLKKGAAGPSGKAEGTVANGTPGNAGGTAAEERRGSASANQTGNTMAGAPSGKTEGTVAGDQSWRHRAWMCGTLDELHAMAREMISKNEWTEEVKSFFTQIKNERGWN